MDNGITTLFFIIFILMSVQMLFGVVHLRMYQKTVKSMVGTGILGIGQYKSWLKGGEILILSYNPREDKVVACKSLKGYTIFAKFKDLNQYVGMTLSEVRHQGIKLEEKRRKGKPYDPHVLSKKKNPLIQAIEAIDLHKPS